MSHTYGSLILILSIWILSQVYGNLTLSKAVIEEMATREMRHYHFLWHQVRNLWNRFDSDTQEQIERLGWAPPRPSQRYENRTSIALENNDSGEDFLYMHRQMIATVNEILGQQENPTRLNGWTNIPSPTSRRYPLPPAYTASNSQLTRTVREWKSDDVYYNFIKPREERFKNPDYLRTLTLGQLGSKIEFTIHDWLHIRFSESSTVGYRRRPVLDPFPDISEQWDDEDYDWLIDSYSSSVNPWFWMIHLWIDDRIEDWREANGLEEIDWKGTWLGGPVYRYDDIMEAGKDVRVRNLAEVASHDFLMKCNHKASNEDQTNEGESHKNEINVLEEVTKIVINTGLEFHFYDKIVFEEDLPSNKSEKCKKLRL